MIAIIAAMTVGIHVSSTHLDPEIGPASGHNDSNPGLFLRNEAGYQVGTYYNSLRKQTFYAGRAWTLAGGGAADVVVFLGAGTGYTYALVPMAAISARVGPARISFTPRVGNVSSGVVHLSLETRF